MRRILALASAVFLFDAYFLHEDETSNARVRLALAKAIVIEGRLTIDTYQAETRDKAFFGGHYYCDKAPLTSILAVAPLAALQILGITHEPTRAYVTRLLTVSLANALALPLFAFVLRRQGVSERATLLTCAAGWFGTALLPYGTVFFGHDVTFALIVGALATLPDRYALAGALLGLAVASDYQAAPLAALLALPVLLRRDAPAILRLALGAMAPLCLLGFYHFALFGNPLTVPVKHEVYAEVHNMEAEYDTGLYGISLPKPRALALLLISPGKGLLSLSPFFLFLPYAFVRRPVDPLTRAAALALPVFLLLIATLPSYHGGFSFGPRLLIPGLPLLLLLLGRAVDAMPRGLHPIFLGTVLWSFSVYAAATATLIAVPYDFTHPLTQIVIPWFLAGTVTGNAGKLLGLEGAASLAPLVALMTPLAVLTVRGAGRGVAADEPLA